jgi:hypothetical protein
MSSLAEFLKGTVSDSLKKLLQPAGLLPAALFVLLNLAFVYPAAVRENVPIALSYQSLDQGWQAAVLATLGIGLGVLLLSSGNFALDTLSGRTWRAAVSFWALGGARDVQRRWLRERIEQMADEPARAEQVGTMPTPVPARRESLELLRWRLRSRFAPEHEHPDDSGHSSGTSLGDALRASAWMTSQRYGMDMTVLWEPLQALVAQGDTGADDAGNAKDAAVASANDEKAVLNLVGTLTVTLVFFVVEAGVVLGLLHHWQGVLTSLLALPVAYLAYRIAVTKAISWSDAIDNVAALHRDKLRPAFGLPEAGDPESYAETRREFRELSYFLRWGGDGVRPVALPPAARSADVLTGNAAATLSATSRQEPPPGTEAREHEAFVRHVLVTAREGCGKCESEAVSVLVHDPLVPHVTTPPGQEATIVPEEGEPDGILWRFGSLTRGTTDVQTYELPRWRAKLENHATMTVAEPSPESLRVTIAGPVDAGTKLKIWHVLGATRVALLTPSGAVTEAPSTSGGSHVWRLPEVPACDVLKLAIDFCEPGASA